MSDETRKDQRVKVQTLKAKYKSATLEQFIEHYAGDISRGGIFIKTPKPAAIGTMLKIEIQLADATPVISAIGRVVWRREAPEASGPAGMGIKFIKLEEDSQAIVERIVASRPAGTGPSFDTIPPPAAPAETAEPVAGKTNSEFFGETNPAEEMPAPQERTMMRQMSAFLGEALRSSAGETPPTTPAAAPPARPPAHKGTLVGMPASAPAPSAPAPAVAKAPAPAALPVATPPPPAATAAPTPARKGTMMGVAPPAATAPVQARVPLPTPTAVPEPEPSLPEESAPATDRPLPLAPAASQGFGDFDDDVNKATVVSSRDEIERLLSEQAAKSAAAKAAVDGEVDGEVSTSVAPRAELEKLVAKTTDPTSGPARSTPMRAATPAQPAPARTAAAPAPGPATPAPVVVRAEKPASKTGLYLALLFIVIGISGAAFFATRQKHAAGPAPAITREPAPATTAQPPPATAPAPTVPTAPAAPELPAAPAAPVPTPAAPEPPAAPAIPTPAAPAPSAPTDTATVRVRGLPAGASVTFDGAPGHGDNGVYTIPAGRPVRLRATAPGFVSGNQIVNLAPGGTQLVVFNLPPRAPRPAPAGGGGGAAVPENPF